jgi:hypothetical protein
MDKIIEKIGDFAVEHAGWYWTIAYTIGLAFSVGLTLLLRKIGFYRWLCK